MMTVTSVSGAWRRFFLLAVCFELLASGINNNNDGGYLFSFPGMPMMMGAEAISACVGYDHTCLVYQAKLYCFGSNYYGQIGAASSVSSIGSSSGSMSKAVALSTTASQVVCGYHATCYLTQSGVAKCFGDGSNYQLGTGSTSSVTLSAATSLPISGVISGIALASTYSYAVGCAYTNSFQVYCWGSSSSYSGLSAVPSLVSGIPSVTITSLAVGLSHACITNSNYDLFCWGSNLYGQIGVPSTTTAKMVPINDNAYNVVAGRSHTCFSTGFSFECFGDNSYYQLGTGNSTSLGTSLYNVTGLTPNKMGTPGTISAGGDNTCVLDAVSSNFYCFGDNTNYANCATSSTSSVGSSSIDYPPYVSHAMTIDVLSANNPIIAIGYGEHQCAYDGNSLICWGDNLYGQLGINSFSSQQGCIYKNQLTESCITSPSCSSSTNSPYSGGIPITPFIPLIIVTTIPLVFYAIGLCFACNKRSQYASMPILLPTGERTTPAKLWKSYKKGGRADVATPLRGPAAGQQAEYAMAAIPVAGTADVPTAATSFNEVRKAPDV